MLLPSGFHIPFENFIRSFLRNSDNTLIGFIALNVNNELNELNNIKEVPLFFRKTRTLTPALC